MGLQRKVLGNEEGLSLQLFLKRYLGEAFSQRQIKLALEKGACLLNGRIERFASTKVVVGDSVKFTEPSLPLASYSCEVLFEDENLICYHKPPTLTTEKLFFHLKNRSLIPVHRLDKETSGVILFAKNRQSALWLEEQFRQRLVYKTYHAIVDGIVREDRGIIINQLGKISFYEGQTIWGTVKKGLKAETHWHCEKRGKQVSLICCKPKTGRTHQLRVHLTDLGHPILGDYQYSKQFRYQTRPPRILLHASHIQIGAGPIISAPFPEDFQSHEIFNC